MMDGAGRLFRIFVDVGTEAGEDGFEVCVREDELSKPNGAARFWARFVCRDIETLLAALDELQPAGWRPHRQSDHLVLAPDGRQ